MVSTRRMTQVHLVRQEYQVIKILLFIKLFYYYFQESVHRSNGRLKEETQAVKGRMKVVIIIYFMKCFHSRLVTFLHICHKFTLMDL